jgi:hypothetical protein
MRCPLCDATGCARFFEDRRRSYYWCESCGLLFVPKAGHIAFEDEKKRYELHDNNIGNSGYVQFLEETVTVIEGLPMVDKRIIDFGSGKNRVLGELFRERGLFIDSFDPLYDIGKEFLNRKYTVLVLCEVIEHFRDLKHEARVIREMVDTNGVILLRTNICPPLENFSAWWYKEDMTHINFFTRKSIERFASEVGKVYVEQREKDIFILHD